jgi:hypothetical protein
MSVAQESCLNQLYAQLVHLEALGFADLDEDDDEIESLEPTHSLQDDPSDRPDSFPPDLWPYVADDQKPLVKARYAKFPAPRLAEITDKLKTADVCLVRPNQKPYIEAQNYANIDAFFHVDEENPPLIKGFEFRIITEPGKKAIGRRNKRWDLLAQKYLKVKEIQLLLTNKCRRSYSDFRNPIMLVQYVERVQKFMSDFGDKAVEYMDDPQYAHLVAAFYRLTIDMRLLNIITKDDLHPMPRIADVIDRFFGNKHFTGHDVQDAFWAVPLADCDRHKTAFETQNMLLEWMVIPQGCKNGAVMFARVVSHYFGDVMPDIDKYQDDIFVHSKNIAKHLIANQVVYDRARLAGLCFSLNKSHFNYYRIKCLGHIITKGGRTPDPTKIHYHTLQSHQPTNHAPSLTPQKINLAYSPRTLSTPTEINYIHIQPTNAASNKLLFAPKYDFFPITLSVGFITFTQGRGRKEGKRAQSQSGSLLNPAEVEGRVLQCTPMAQLL